jgi:hypothetical protein
MTARAATQKEILRAIELPTKPDVDGKEGKYSALNAELGEECYTDELESQLAIGSEPTADNSLVGGY